MVRHICNEWCQKVEAMCRVLLQVSAEVGIGTNAPGQPDNGMSGSRKGCRCMEFTSSVSNIVDQCTELESSFICNLSQVHMTQRGTKRYVCNFMYEATQYR